MDRRTTLGALAMLLGAVPGAARAQAGLPKRIGFLGNANPTAGATQLEALRGGLRELGWVEGRDVGFVFGWADGRPDRIPALVSELVQAKVDVMVVSGSVAIAAAKLATRTIPVVFVVLIDPVPLGLVQSLARPGGNMTGLASQFDELITKQLQLMKEALPRMSRVGFLHHVESSRSTLFEADAAARSLGFVSRTFSVAREGDLTDAFEGARRENMAAMLVLPSPFLGAVRTRVIALAARHRLPAFYELRLYVDDGGLLSYGPSIPDLYGRSAIYVDRILKGANPADMPIERPARFELVINLKTAEALGLALPASLLSRADEVIR